MIPDRFTPGSLRSLLQWRLGQTSTVLSLGLSLLAPLSSFAMSQQPSQQLTSESIAERALEVAQQRHSTGYCYAGVSSALRPLGINLHGSAAYQAKDILSQDPRFASITAASADELRRGDIIVFGKSASHPYGHICVYEGNYEEASDHVAKVTKTQAYGGSSVFRLKNDMAYGDSSQFQPPQPDRWEQQAYNQDGFHRDSPRPPENSASQPHSQYNRYESAVYSAVRQRVKGAVLRGCMRLLNGL